MRLRLCLVTVAICLQSLWSVDALSAQSAAVEACQNLTVPEHKDFCVAHHSGDVGQCELISESSNWRGLCQLSRSPELGACENLPDENFLNYCYALNQGTSIPCFYITDKNLEFLCYAHVQNTNRFCADVSDVSLNALCKALYAADKSEPRPPR